MKTKRLLAASGLALAMAAALPATAAPFCSGDYPGIGIGVTIGPDGDWERDEAYDLDRYRTLLRQDGVDVTRVEKWNGCLRAWVRNGSGGEAQVFFDPVTLAPIPY